MAIFHHSTESYAVSAARGANVFKAKWQKIFCPESMARAQDAYVGKMEESWRDYLLPSDKIIYAISPESGKLTLRRLENDSPGLPLTDHAFTQALGRAGINIPTPFARKLLASKSSEYRDLVATMLQTLNRAEPGEEPEKHMIRIESNQVKAVLTSSYKRLPSKPQLHAFAEACGAAGMVPVDGHRTDLKTHFRMALPQIFEPVKNEPIVLGLSYSTSEVGAGYNRVDLNAWRLWCTNCAESESLLRQVHLGRSLDTLEDEHFSERTRQLQAETQASAMRDVINGFLAGDRIEAFCEAIRAAANSKTDTDKVIDSFYSRSRVSKGERDRLHDIAKSTDVEILPPVGENGDNAWRTSNVFSAYAKELNDSDKIRAREFEKLAGQVLRDYVTENKRENLLALPADTRAITGEYTEAAE